jgi:hypothetical protein
MRTRSCKRNWVSAAAAVVLFSALAVPAGQGTDTPRDGVAAPAPEPSTNAPPATGSEPPPPPALVLDPAMVQSILGREVRSIAGENMGRIVDVIVERSGEVRAAVIDFGGFLGVGSRKIAVDWSMLRFGTGEKSDRVTLDLTRNQVKAAPEYKEGKPIIVLGAATGMPPAEPTSAPAR